MTAPPLAKYLNVLPPAAIKDNAAWTFTEVDTLGFKWARYIFVLGATDIAFAAVPTITESDTAGSGHAAITSANTSAIADDADNGIYVIDVKLEGRKRYLNATATAGNGALGTYLAAICELYKAELPPVNATQAGLAEHVAV